jgi:hypothetical protein
LRTIEASSSSARGAYCSSVVSSSSVASGADLGVEVRADAAEGLVHRERVEIAAAFIEQIAGDGGEARADARDPATSRSASARNR